MQTVDRGRVWEIEVAKWRVHERHGVMVRVFLHPFGDFHVWAAHDKRLQFLASARPFADTDAFLALLKSCLNPGQRAWLTRWLNDPQW